MRSKFFRYIFLGILIQAANVMAGSLICMEAESAIKLEPLVILGGDGIAVAVEGWHAVDGASGGKYIEIPQAPIKSPEEEKDSEDSSKKIQGKAVYEFEVASAGVYYLWCRVWWLDSCGNSLSINLDAAKPFAFGQDRTFKTWHWVKAIDGLKQLNLSGGTHTLTIHAREDGVRVDQILLTKNKNYVPVGIEDVTVKPTEKTE